MMYILAFVASFVFIFLKAFQQRNVAFMNYGWVMPTSMAMACTEVYVIASVAHSGWSPVLVLCIGAGSGLGATIAMYVHNRWVKK